MKLPFFNPSRLKKHGILLNHPVHDDRRCRECDAACCRSFPSVDLTWAEYQQLRELGASRLQFSITGNCQLIIENGCEFLVASKCGIYEHRPDICRRFYCEDLPNSGHSA